MSITSSWKKKNMRKKKPNKDKKDNYLNNYCKKHMYSTYKLKNSNDRKKCFYNNSLNKRCSKNSPNNKDCNKWPEKRDEWKNSNIRKRLKGYGKLNLISIEKLRKDKDKKKNRRSLLKCGESTLCKNKNKNLLSNMLDS